MATLTTTVTESCALNGHTYGNTRTQTHTNVTQVLQQVLKIDTNEFSLYDKTDNAEPVNAASMDAESIKYMRITNLSSSIDLIMHLDESASTETALLRIAPGASFIMGKLDDGLQVEDDSNVTAPSMVDIEAISLEAASSTVEVEYFVASGDVAA